MGGDSREVVGKDDGEGACLIDRGWGGSTKRFWVQRHYVVQGRALGVRKGIWIWQFPIALSLCIITVKTKRQKPFK